MKPRVQDLRLSSAAPFPKTWYARRIVWDLTWATVRWLPGRFFLVRRVVLGVQGARVSSDCRIRTGVKIRFPWNLSVGTRSTIGDAANIWNLGRVEIGSNVVLSQRVHICAGTHDHLDPALPLLTSPITIEDEVWICAEAFIGPGVTVGRGAVVGARAVVTRDVAPYTVVAGNPAREIGRR